MFKRALGRIVVAITLTTAPMADAQAPPEPASLPAGTALEAIPGWYVSGADRKDHIRKAPWLGRDALWLRGGTHVVRRGVSMRDGTIEFDLAPSPTADFVGITFRRQSLAQHENIYFRIQRSGDFMAVQYAPRIGSSSWQLYPEFLATADLPVDTWTHVRIEVRGSKLDVYVGKTDKPTLSVDRMRHSSLEGEIAVWARVNNKPEVWAAGISNFTVKLASSAAPIDPPQPPPRDVISTWRIAGPYPADKAGQAPPADAAWKLLTAEESGLINLSRAIPQQPNTKQVAYAKAVIVSDTARTVRLGVGYSDQVDVWLNGQPVYGAVNGFNSRHPGYTGFVDTRYEHAWLNLKPGRNELLYVSADDQAFGWGFAGRLESMDGLTFEQP